MFPVLEATVVTLYNREIFDAGREPGLIVLLAFLVSFGFIRTSAWLMKNPKVPWWPGSVTTEGGMHIHHVVWGVSLLLIFGFLEFAMEPNRLATLIFAAFFGIGAGLTLDEFALILHLKDVYWEKEGRASIDAVIMSAVFAGFVFAGFAPVFNFDAGNPAWVAIPLGIGILALSLISFFKGRLLLGTIGLFIVFSSIWGAVRLSKPSAPWAHWFYVGRRQGKLERARKRFRDKEAE